jgi:hypothetical protein
LPTTVDESGLVRRLEFDHSGFSWRAVRRRLRLSRAVTAEVDPAFFRRGCSNSASADQSALSTHRHHALASRTNRRDSDHEGPLVHHAHPAARSRRQAATLGEHTAPRFSGRRSSQPLGFRTGRSAPLAGWDAYRTSGGRLLHSAREDVLHGHQRVHRQRQGKGRVPLQGKGFVSSALRAPAWFNVASRAAG